MGRTLVAVAVLAAVISVPSASAKRAPTSGERGAIRSMFAGYAATPGSPAAKDNKIVTIAVSSVDRRYASARLFSKSAGPSEMVFHRSHGTWFVVGFGSSMGCDSAPKPVLADLGVGCSPPAATAWIWNCGPLVSAPKSFVITCADANYVLSGLRWHGWGTGRATASGTAHANDCTPTCVAGRFHAYPMTAVADRLSRCGKARYYARLTIVYAGARPQGIAKRDVNTLGC